MVVWHGWRSGLWEDSGMASDYGSKYGNYITPSQGLQLFSASHQDIFQPFHHRLRQLLHKVGSV